MFVDAAYEARQAFYDPGPWVAALERIDVLDRFPDFRQWLKTGLLEGYGIGRREPWARYAAQGYR